METTARTTRRGWRGTTAALALLATTTAGLAACSSAGDDSSGGSAAEEVATSQDTSANTLSRRGAAQGDAAAEAPSEEDGAATDVVAPAATDPQLVVSHGTVALRAADVGAARAEVQRIVDTVAGQVSESDTETDDDGAVVRGRMVLRVPVKEFDDAMQALEQVADLRSSDQRSDVVTEEYADLDARVRAQEASLRRVQLLFERAESIRDIVSIESQLTSRQAELDSLKGQLRVLEDRAAQSTIVVHLSRTPEERTEPEKEDTAGFLAGLDAGWTALTAGAVTLATVAGALLPFAVLVLLLGVPVWLLVRRRRTSAGPAAPAPAE